LTFLQVSPHPSSRVLRNCPSAPARRRDRAISSARAHSRAMNKAVVFRPGARERAIFGKILRGPAMNRWLRCALLSCPARLRGEITRPPVLQPSVVYQGVFQQPTRGPLRRRQQPILQQLAGRPPGGRPAGGILRIFSGDPGACPDNAACFHPVGVDRKPQ
jgi:hypothetical protein